MAISPIWDEQSLGGGVQIAVVLDYDTVARTVGLTVTGSGHAVLTLYNNASPPATEIASLDCDQFPYDGQRRIVAGPGAAGVRTSGQALPTAPVPAAVVARVNPPHGQQPTLIVDLTWNP